MENGKQGSPANILFSRSAIFVIFLAMHRVFYVSRITHHNLAYKIDIERKNSIINFYGSFQDARAQEGHATAPSIRSGQHNYRAWAYI